MNRRSFLRLLGFSSVAAPLATKAAAPSDRIAANFSIDPRAAGCALDFLPDGTSRMIVEASAFSILPPIAYEFDGQHLRIPNLMLRG